MPKLVRLYIIQVLIGFALSAAFVALLLWQNVANLGHLVLTSDIGWLALLMLFVFNGLVFAGVQFSITIMRMGEDDTPKGGGRRDPVLSEWVAVPARVKRG
ncbi:MAG: hypothetical protein WBN04_13195 [Paracoccaceae bacterium]